MEIYNEKIFDLLVDPAVDVVKVQLCRSTYMHGLIDTKHTIDPTWCQSSRLVPAACGVAYLPVRLFTSSLTDWFIALCSNDYKRGMASHAKLFALESTLRVPARSEHAPI